MPQVITAASGEILDLPAAKEYLQVEDGNTSDDQEIQSLLVAARAEAEAISRRTLMESVTRRHELHNWPLDEFGCRRWQFQFPPLHHTPAITVEYYDTNDTLQTVASTNYDIEPTLSSGQIHAGVSTIRFKPNYTLPQLTSDRDGTRVIITYTTGWGDWKNLPQGLRGTVEIARSAIKLLLWEYYHKDTADDSFGVNVGLSRKTAKELLGAISFGFYA